MPFENCIAKVYTSASIWQNAPPASGIFGLSNARGWLYVDDTDDIRGSLLELLESAAAMPFRKGATGFSFELRAPGDRAQRRAQLLAELRPLHLRPEARTESTGRRN